MKYPVLLSFLLLLPFLSFGQYHYTTGDTLHVWAQSGLRLRAKPSPNATVLATIAHGQNIVVTTPKDSLFLLTFQEKLFPLDTTKDACWRSFYNGETPFNSLPLKGYWVKINWGKMTGYVFDGYLSRLPTMKYITHEIGQPGQAIYQVLEPFKVYAEREFGLLEVVGDDTMYISDHRYARYTFREGIIYINEGGSGWGSNAYFFSKLSPNEGYLLINTLLHWERYPDSPNPPYNPNNCLVITSFEASNKVTLLWELTEIITFEQVNGVLIIYFFSAC